MPANEVRRICAVTMVKDDYFFLEKWIAYYQTQLGIENLVVISHGLDPLVAEIAKGAAVIPAPQRIDDSRGHKNFEIDRFNLINNICNGLVRYYDAVLCVDVDEFIVVDPKINKNLREYVASHPEITTFTCIGMDIFQKCSLAADPIDAEKTVLSQRYTARVEPLYCKPVITRREIVRSIGNHNSDDPNLFFAPDLYLFHLKWMDKGWSMNMHYNRHIAKSNVKYVRGKDLIDCGFEFPLRAKIEETFREFDELPHSGNNFNFEKEMSQFERSWRRRRFLFQKDFYRSFLSKKAPYSLHWRFDLIRSHEFHVVPERFRGIF